MLRSSFIELGKVSLPFNLRQLYMEPFDLGTLNGKSSFPVGYEDYLETVRNLCDAIGAYEGTAYLTVDEKVLQKGDTHRKPHAHVDGRYITGQSRWGHGGGGWNHSCNVVPARMAVIVASSVALCDAWDGVFLGTPKLDGSCQHIVDDDIIEPERLKANVGYLLAPDCIHESVPAPYEVARSFLRIALPLDFHWKGGH